MRDVVYVFARLPRLGTVKRRLARDVGERAAWRFYTRTLANTLRELRRDRRFTTVLAVTPDSACRGGSWPAGIPRVPQGRGTLEHRMHRVLQRHQRGRAAIVGSDIPDLSANDVARAFRMLGHAQACFGPARDGGYWLVALSPRRPGAPFARVRWSSEWALRDTLANFTGRKIALLRELSDVDTGADLRRVQMLAQAGHEFDEVAGAVADVELP